MIDVLNHVCTERAAGRAVALCAIVATRGSTPQPTGTLVCVDEAARMTGTLGGGCAEAELRRRAHHLLSTRRSALLTFRLDHDFGYDDGMICGGEMDVAVTVFSPDSDGQLIDRASAQLADGGGAILSLRVVTASGPAEYRLWLEAGPELVIAGGGHISRVLAPMMVLVGFRVSVIDDRCEYANAERFPPPIHPIAAPIAATLKTWPIGANTYVVLVTRGHRHDESALQAVLGSPAKYIGMIGSRRKIDIIFDDLRHRGAAEEQLNRVRAPIGLDIGAVTTDEIAVSIAAELVKVRRATSGPRVEGPFAVEPAAGETLGVGG
jgi:xanthine dehydrogenase accessory factor